MKKQITILLLVLSGFTVQAQNYDVWIPGAIDWNPATPGGFLKISQTAACNYGPGNANESFEVGLIVKNETTEDIYIIAKQTITNPDIPQGNCMAIYNLEGYIADATPPVPSGTYVWGVWLDSGEEITEPDETNNFRIINNTINWNSSLEIESNESASALNVSPNPVSSYLNIGVKEPTSIKIMNVSGATVSTQRLSPGSNSIDVSDLTNGIYFLRTETGATKKFVKE